MVASPCEMGQGYARSNQVWIEDGVGQQRVSLGHAGIRAKATLAHCTFLGVNPQPYSSRLVRTYLDSTPPQDLVCRFPLLQPDKKRERAGHVVSHLSCINE